MGAGARQIVSNIKRLKVSEKEIKKILSGHGSPGDKETLLQWISSGTFEKELSQIIASELEQGLSVESQISDPELKAMADEIIRNAGKLSASRELRQAEYNHNLGNKRNSSSTTSFIIKIAAALLVVALFTFVAVYFTKTSHTEEVTVTQTITKENLKGRKSTIFLKDGSVVYLNSESKIQYPENFSDTLRMLSLEGEAFFEITNDEKKPFVVKTGDLSIRVLGTSFNVFAYEDSENIKISLSSGKVVIDKLDASSRENAGIELNTGQSVSYSTKENTFTKISPFDHNLDLGWKDGKIVFKNAGMESMLKQFERWYNVSFELANKPYFKWNYTGEFTSQTLEDVLESLSFSQSFEYKINNDKVKLVFKPIK